MVSVVITCWNGKELLAKNLPKVIKAATNKKNKIDEILVVDDASSDGSSQYLAENFPSIRVVKHNSNLGYSATCNTGVRESMGLLVAILNLDVVPSENFLENALPHFSDKQVFSVSFDEGTFGPGKLAWKDGFLEILPNPSNNELSPTDWASGGSSVFRKGIWQEIGGMDELFLPFYFEDIDLSLRAREEGFFCLWEPKSKVVHLHESTINTSSFSKRYVDSIKQRNQLLLTWKNINSFDRLGDHSLFLAKRIIASPGYLRILLLALLRKINFSFIVKK